MKRSISKHFRRFILSDRNGFDPGTVNFGKISGIVQGKGDNNSSKTIIAVQSHTENIVWTEKANQQLQHQRSSTHDGNINLENPAYNCDFRHPPERNQQSERQRKHKGQHKNKNRNSEAFQQGLEHVAVIHKTDRIRV